MRILLLSQWFPPEPQRLLADLVIGLQSLGHEVTVLTGFPNFPTGKIYPGYRQHLYQRECLEGMSVIRLPLYPDHSHSALKRILSIFSFSLSASLLGPFLAPKVDAIYVIHPPATIGLAAWLLSRLRRAPFVYEIQDMWPESLQATGMLRRKWMLWLVNALTNWCYRRAAAIRVLSPGFRENLIGKGVPPEKIHFVSNWIDTDFYHPLEPDSDFAATHGLADRFNVLFAGMIGPAQALDVVLDAAERLRDLPNVQFVLVGDGNDQPRLKKEAQERGLVNVKFLGRFQESEMGKFFAVSDVLLVHLRNDPLFGITIPHKIYTYMAVGKPILAALSGDPAEVVVSEKAGIACPSGDPAALADAVRRLRALPPAELREMGGRGRQAACNKYHRNVLVPEIAEILRSITGKN